MRSEGYHMDVYCDVVGGAAEATFHGGTKGLVYRVLRERGWILGTVSGKDFCSLHAGFSHHYRAKAALQGQVE